MTAPMWMTDCPDEETLAAFIDDRVDIATRRKIMEHLAGCGECRELVLMATDFQASEGGQVIRGKFAASRWLPIAAGFAVAAVLSTVYGRPWLFGPDLNEVVETSQTLKNVPFEGRLAGGFGHIQYASPKRGMPDPNAEMNPDLSINAMREIANNDARFGSAHVHGVAMLLSTDGPETTDDAIRMLKEAYAKASPGDERDTVAVNRAAALLARDRWASTDQRARDQLALDLSDDVWRRRHTPEAAWNRALALEALSRKADAVKAWDDYLSLDSSSEWAKEASTKRSRLIEDLNPPTR
jgi:hypothetical protein